MIDLVRNMSMLVKLMGGISMLFAAIIFAFYQPLLNLASISVGNPFFVQLAATIGFLFNSMFLAASTDLVRYRLFLKYCTALKLVVPGVMLYHLLFGNLGSLILIPMVGDLVMGIVCLTYLIQTHPRWAR